MHRIARALPVLAVLLCACSSAAPPAASSASQPRASSTKEAAKAVTKDGTGDAVKASRTPRALSDSDPTTAAGGPGRFPPTHRGKLDGKVILVDPGHNGGNFKAPAVINRIIWNGRENETCDTTGTETDGGYTEALFNWHVALDLTADLRAEGATVVLTRTSNTGVGPCVTERAALGNQAHANVAVSIHADGGPPGGRGFAILEPVADGINNKIVGPSAVLGADLRAAFEAGTGEPVSSYDGINGIQPRDDLAGINLSTVPKVFIECANMRNTADAALITSARWQARAARAIAVGLAALLTRR